MHWMPSISLIELAKISLAMRVEINKCRIFIVTTIAVTEVTIIPNVNRHQISIRVRLANSILTPR